MRLTDLRGLLARADEMRGITSDDTIGRKIVSDDGSCPDNGALA